MRQYATFLIPTICFTFHLSSNTGFVNSILTANDKLLAVFPGTGLRSKYAFWLPVNASVIYGSDGWFWLLGASAACSNLQKFNENKKNDKKKKHGIRIICGLDDNLPRFCHGA